MTMDEGPDPTGTGTTGSDGTSPEAEVAVDQAAGGTADTARVATPETPVGTAAAADKATADTAAAADAAAADSAAAATAAPTTPSTPPAAMAAAPEAIAPATAAATEPPARGQRKRRVAAQLIGIVGLVVSVVLAVLIFMVHASVSTGINDVFDTADKQIERGSTIVELATSRVQERVSDIDDFIATVSAITPGADLPPALVERATSIADRYDAVRNQFAELRARVESAIETVRQVARLVPFIDLPTGPTDELATLDAKLQQFDDSLSQLREGGLAGAAIDRVVQGATNLRGTISDIAQLGGRVQTRLDEAQQRLDQANSRIDGVLWLVTAVLLALVAYVAFLNVLVIWLARR